MKRHAIIPIVFSIVALLAGCTVARYKVGDETFHSSSEALKRQAEKLSILLNEITPTGNSVHGAVLVLIPSDPEIQKNHIRFSNNPSQFNKEQIDWGITTVRNDCRFMADAIKKRGIFDTVSVASHNGDPNSFPVGDHDFIVYFDVDGWYIRTKDDARPVSLPFDNSKPVGAPRTISFLDLLHQQAAVIRVK